MNVAQFPVTGWPKMEVLLDLNKFNLEAFTQIEKSMDDLVNLVHLDLTVQEKKDRAAKLFAARLRLEKSMTIRAKGVLNLLGGRPLEDFIRYVFDNAHTFNPEVVAELGQVMNTVMSKSNYIATHPIWDVAEQLAEILES